MTKLNPAIEVEKSLLFSRIVYVRSMPGGGKHISINRSGVLRDYYTSWEKGNRIDQWLKTICKVHTIIWGTHSYLMSTT